MDAFLRRYATPLSLVTGLAISITGIMMFFGIRGEIGELHEWLGWAFVVAIVMHMVRNWRGVLGMLKPWRAKAIVGVLSAAMIALVITHLPSGENGGRGGGPWLVVNRVANVPISAAAPALGTTSEAVITKLKAQGIAVKSADQTLAQVAREKDIELQKVFALLLQE